MIRLPNPLLILFPLLLTACGPDINENLALRDTYVLDTAISELIKEARSGEPSAVLAETLQVGEKSIALAGNPSGIFTGATLDKVLKGNDGEKFTGEQFLIYANVSEDKALPMKVVVNFPGTDIRYPAMLSLSEAPGNNDASPKLLLCMHLGAGDLLCQSANELLKSRRREDYGLAEGISVKVFNALTQKTKIEVSDKHLGFSKKLANTMFKQAEINELGTIFKLPDSCSHYAQQTTLDGLSTEDNPKCKWEVDTLLDRDANAPYLKKMEERRLAISKAVFGSNI